MGTDSRRLAGGQGGSPFSTLRLATCGNRHDLLICGVPAGRELEQLGQQQPAEEGTISEKREQGSVIVVLATDAPLDARQLGRLTRRVPFGLARTGTHGGRGSGA